MHPRIEARLQSNLALKLAQLDSARATAIDTLTRLQEQLSPRGFALMPEMRSQIEGMIALLDGIDARSADAVARDIDLVRALEQFAASLRALAHHAVQPAKEGAELA